MILDELNERDLNQLEESVEAEPRHAFRVPSSPGLQTTLTASGSPTFPPLALDLAGSNNDDGPKWWQRWVALLAKGKCPSPAQALVLLEQTATMIRSKYPRALARLNLTDEPSEVESITVVGDLHGQLGDLLEIFDRVGLPSPRRYFIFNGDLVDRGPYGFEVCAILFVLMLAFPRSVWINRGNHECRFLNEAYSFDGEIRSKFGSQSNLVFDAFQEVFQCLPLAMLLNEKVLIVHGGLPNVTPPPTLAEIEALDFRGEVPRASKHMSRNAKIFRQLLWNDPGKTRGFRPNLRGEQLYMFGRDVTTQFLDDNGLLLFVRSHEPVDDGYKLHHGHKLVTVFSASNYCAVETNLGAVLTFPRNGVDEQTGLPSFNMIQYSVSSSTCASSFCSTKVSQADRMIDDTLKQLSDRIFNKKDALLFAFQQADPELTGALPLDRWKAVLCRVLAFDAPWLFLRKYIVAPEFIDQRVGHTDMSRILYAPFLASFKIVVRQNLVQRWESILLDGFIAKMAALAPSLDDLFSKVNKDTPLGEAEIISVAREHGIKLSSYEVRVITGLFQQDMDLETFKQRFEQLRNKVRSSSIPFLPQFDIASC